MLTEDYIVRMIRDMGQMLARVLGSQAWEPDRCAEVWEAAAGDCPPLLEELKALAAEGRLEEALLPVERLFGEYPAVWVSPAQAQRFQNGGALDLERLRRVPPEGLCRVKGPQGLFLGLGRVEPEAGQLRFVKSFLEQEGTP